jgi:hypothetical protein
LARQQRLLFLLLLLQHSLQQGGPALCGCLCYSWMLLVPPVPLLVPVLLLVLVHEWLQSQLQQRLHLLLLLLERLQHHLQLSLRQALLVLHALGWMMKQAGMPVSLRRSL